MGFKKNRTEEPEEKTVTEVITEAFKEIKFPEVVAEVPEEKTEVKKIVKKQIPERIVKPPYIGIMGDTIEVRDFRAIVKKKGDTITNVLSKIISEYNEKNYNL